MLHGESRQGDFPAVVQDERGDPLARPASRGTEGIGHGPLIAGPGKACEITGDDFLFGQAQDPEGGFVRVENPPGAVELEHPLRHARDEALQVLLDPDELPDDPPAGLIVKPQDLRPVPEGLVVEDRQDVLGELVEGFLADAGVGPEGPEVEHLALGKGRDDADVALPGTAALADQAAEPVARHPGHHHVDEQDVGDPGVQQLEGTGAVLGGPDLVPVTLQEFAQQGEQHGIIVDNQDSFRVHGRSAAGSFPVVVRLRRNGLQKSNHLW